MGRNDIKVVIVGAGPAGLITALNLAQRKISPVILEKQPAIKSTACAEACDQQSLNKIPFNSNGFISKRVKGVKIYYCGGTISFMNKAGVAVLNRTSWLKGMAKEIEIRGGQIRLASEVVAIQESSVQLKNGEKVDYDILIGADGPNSCVARHLGIKHKFVVASQYKVAFDTSNMDYLEFYHAKTPSPVYGWIFPKDGVMNIGVLGNLAQLDAFLRHKGVDNCQIVEREVGIIPISGIHKMVQNNIALIGDSASMPNPVSLGGLAPIIYASQILVANIENLENYEREVKKHPIAAPALLKARQALLALTKKDLTKIRSFLAETHRARTRWLYLVKIVKYPSLLLKLSRLVNICKAKNILINYGW